jgi:bacterioferritin-associated ferredoxin
MVKKKRKPDDLTQRQSLAIPALLSSRSVEEAARKCGCSVKSLRTWLADPAFRKQFTAERRKIIDQTITNIINTGDLAVKTLEEACGSGNKMSDRIRAATELLAQKTHVAAMLNFQEQLEELKAEREAGRQATTQVTTPLSTPLAGTLDSPEVDVADGELKQDEVEKPDKAAKRDNGDMTLFN